MGSTQIDLLRLLKLGLMKIGSLQSKTHQMQAKETARATAQGPQHHQNRMLALKLQRKLTQREMESTRHQTKSLVRWRQQKMRAQN